MGSSYRILARDRFSAKIIATSWNPTPEAAEKEFRSILRETGQPMGIFVPIDANAPPAPRWYRGGKKVP